MKFRFAMACAIVVLLASAHSAFAQGTIMDWTIDGVKRQALIFAPKSGDSKHSKKYQLKDSPAAALGRSLPRHDKDLRGEAHSVVREERAHGLFHFSRNPSSFVRGESCQLLPECAGNLGAHRPEF